MNKTKQLAVAFEKGAVLTGSQITEIFGLKNPGEAVRQLRAKGMCIYTNPNGYRLGTPTKSMVAAINKIFGSAPFTKN